MRHFLNFQTWCAIIYIIYLYEKASSVTDSDALQKDALQSTNVIDDDYSLDNDSSNTSTDNPLAVDKIIKNQNDNELKSTSELMPFVTTVQTSSDCNNCSTKFPKCRLKQDGTPTTDCITEIFTDERCWKCNGFNEICPDDSLLVQLEYPLCCNSTAIKCQCKKCQPIKCGSNQSLMFLSVGSNKPGSCCDTYKCIEGPDMCSYDKVIYKDGDVWYPDKCSICRCDQGLVYCSRKTCQPQMGCGYMYTPANECCSICGGCMSDSRLFMLNQSWFEADGCFKCNCYQGRAKCTAEYCLSPPCKNPKKIENVCCPVCEDGDHTDMIITPSTCSAIDKSVLLNCNLTCEFGLQRGVGGCLQCSCAALSCFSVCLYGHSFYESTRRSCECRSAGCKRIHCDKICIHGFQESNQCTVCKCRPCPKLNCTNTCIYGIRFNSYGCLTCDCLKGNERIQNEPIFHQCLHEDKTVDHMEIFYDGCRQCICLNGTTLCSLISCSSANICPTMTFNPGDCCPRCTLDDHRSIQIKIPDILNNLCVGSLGRPLPDGESLIIDKCTTCKCFMGKAFCSVAQCEQPLSNCSLPVSSISPFNIFGSCCPVCSMSNKLVTSDLTNKSLSSARQRCVDGQVVHSDGDIWISNVCQSCICRNGITYCYPHRCPLLSCSVAVLKKGTCCPFCLERALMTVCIFNENVYRNGDGWNISDCSSCVCSKGQIVCTRTLCSPLRCKLPVLLPGHCCPICLDLLNLNLGSVDQDLYQNKNSAVKKPGAQSNNMLYASLLVAIILLVIIVVALLIVIILRANLFVFSNSRHRPYKPGGHRHHNAFSITAFSKRGGKFSNRKRKSFTCKESSVASSLCASIQFDNTDNSAGNLLLASSTNGCGNCDNSTKLCDQTIYCSKCSLTSAKMLEGPGRLIKYEIIGGGASKCGGATVSISEHNPQECCITTTGIYNPSSAFMLSSYQQHHLSVYDDGTSAKNINRTLCHCSCPVVRHQQQKDNINPNNQTDNLNDLIWNNNHNDSNSPNTNDKIYNEIEDKCEDNDSVIYV